MIHYILLDSAGTVRQRGACGTKEEIPSVNGWRPEIVEPSDPRQPSGMPAPGYSEYRRMDYPTVGEQLDMLWHAMDDGVMPKIEPWYSRIKAVKLAHPKPR